MRLLLLLLLCGGISIHSIAQTDCYEEQLRFGDAFCERGDTRRALINWQAGLEYCQLTAQQRNTLQERINNATQNCKRPIPDDMVRIPGGDFDMGDTFDDEGAGSDEKPTHRVSITTFYMSKYETSFQDFDAFCDSTGRAKPNDQSWGHGLLPVINVDWYDAVEYCNWRSQREGLNQVYTLDKTQKDVNNLYTADPKRWVVTANEQANGYRLPTEAEWEYAAREGGKKYRFGNGKNTANPEEMNFDARADYKSTYSVIGIYRFKTAEVNHFSPNALGLYNMSGNVWEWCWDWYDENYYKTSPLDNPKGAQQGKCRILRGGSWSISPRYVRATIRIRHFPDLTNLTLGFRVVARYD